MQLKKDARPVSLNLIQVCKLEKVEGSMKSRTAEGSDGIVFEMVEAAVDFAITKLVDLTNKIYEHKNIQHIMEDTEFIVIPKTRSIEPSVS